MGAQEGTAAPITFFYPDCTVDSGISPDHEAAAAENEFRFIGKPLVGYHHRSGIGSELPHPAPKEYMLLTVSIAMQSWNVNSDFYHKTAEYRNCPNLRRSRVLRTRERLKFGISYISAYFPNSRIFNKTTGRIRKLIAFFRAWAIVVKMQAGRLLPERTQ